MFVVVVCLFMVWHLRMFVLLLANYALLLFAFDVHLHVLLVSVCALLLCWWLVLLLLLCAGVVCFVWCVGVVCVIVGVLICVGCVVLV